MAKKKPAKQRARSSKAQQDALKRFFPTLSRHEERWAELVRTWFARARENTIAIGIAIILFLRPFVSGKTYQWSNGVCQIAIYALFAMWIARACRLKKLTFRAPLLTVGLAGFVIVSGITFFTGVNSDETYRRFFELLSYLLMFVMAASAVRTPRAVTGIVIAVTVASVLVCGHGFYQGLFGLEDARAFVQQHGDWVRDTIVGDDLTPEFIHRISSNRIFSYFLHPNSFAGYLILLIPISICSFIATLRTTRSAGGVTEKRERQPGRGDEELPPFSVVAWLIVAMVQLAALIWTFSRGAWLSLFVSLLCLAFFVLVRRRDWLRDAAVVVSLCVVCTALSYAAQGQEGTAVQGAAENALGPADAGQGEVIRGESPTVSDLVSQETWQARISYWQGAVRMIKARPFLGVGSAAFGSAYPRFKSFGGYDSQEAHNDPLQVLAEAGIAGFVPFMAFWVIVVLFGLRRSSVEGSISVRWLRVGLLFGIVCFLLHSLVDFDFQIPGIALTVYALCGLLIAASDAPERAVRFGWGIGTVVFIALAGATAMSLRPHVADALFNGIGFAVPGILGAWWKFFVSGRLLCVGVVVAVVCAVGAGLMKARLREARRAYAATVAAACLSGFVALMTLPQALANMSVLMAVTTEQRGFGLMYRANQLEAAHKIFRGEPVSDLVLVTLFPNKEEREKIHKWRETGADPAALTRARLEKIKAELSCAAYLYPYGALYEVYIGKVESWLAPFEHDPVRGWDNAIAHLERAVELNPWNAYWHVLLGQAYGERARLGNRRDYLTKALREFQEAVDSYPTSPEVWRHFGTALYYAGERTRAQACFRQAQELRQRAARGR
jgi:putative inorganic carbon (HCO3(-)) transporter